MHTHAQDLKPLDKFTIAGNLFKILDIYEVDDESLIKFAFAPLFGPGRFNMTIARNTLFHLV